MMNYYDPESADPEPAHMQKYPSMRELAYRKLREVKMMREGGLVRSEEKIKSKGRLKLAVYANTPTHLTVNIIEAVPGARVLSRGGSESSLTRGQRRENSAAYVRITQIPEDADRRLVVKTRIIETTESSGNKYHFNDKFSFEICQLNPRNRLVIGLWTIGNQSNSQGNVSNSYSNIIPISVLFSEILVSKSNMYILDRNMLLKSFFKLLTHFK